MWKMKGKKQPLCFKQFTFNMTLRNCEWRKLVYNIPFETFPSYSKNETNFYDTENNSYSQDVAYQQSFQRSIPIAQFFYFHQSPEKSQGGLFYGCYERKCLFIHVLSFIWKQLRFYNLHKIYWSIVFFSFFVNYV